jgi:hypothetical protein
VFNEGITLEQLQAQVAQAARAFGL